MKYECEGITNCETECRNFGRDCDGEKEKIHVESVIWHEIRIREPTEEEITEWEEMYDVPLCYYFDCPMPDDGETILIATKYGVDTDVCAIDEGYYLEGRGDWDDVIAWAYMPKYEPKKVDKNG